MAAMANPSTSVDYERDQRPDKTARPATANGPRADARAAARPAAAPDDAGLRSPDFAAVEEFLQLLARAVRQFHTYPGDQPAVHRRDRRLSQGTRVARRTRSAVVPRHAARGRRRSTSASAAARSSSRSSCAGCIARTSRRSTSIAAPRPATCRASAPTCSAATISSKSKTTLVGAAGRARRRHDCAAAGAPARGARRSARRRPHAAIWSARERRRRAGRRGQPARPAICILRTRDGSGSIRRRRFDTISLVDLAILVDDPADIASMLLRLTDDEAGGRVARRRAAAEIQRRRHAARARSIRTWPASCSRSWRARCSISSPSAGRICCGARSCPGCSTAAPTARCCATFPNVDLAESLCLLMDLETAAPELLTTALDRLDLPAERREVVAPMMEARLREGASAEAPDRDGRDPDIDRHARRLIRSTAAAGKSFAEFAAFDLSIDDQTTAALDAVRDGDRHDRRAGRRSSGSCCNLVRLEPNPAIVEAFLRRSMIALRRARTCRAAGGARGVGRRVPAARGYAASVAPRRRRRDLERADVVLHRRARVGAVRACTRLTPPGARAPTRWSRHSALRSRPPSSRLLDDPAMRTSTRALVPLMCEHGRLLAPTLASRLGQVRRRRRTRDHQGDRLCRLRLRERARRAARARRRADRPGSGAGA